MAAAMAVAAVEQDLEGQQEVAVAEDQVDDFVPLDALIQMGIAQADIKKAKEAGFHTCQSLIMYTKKTLGEIKGLSEAKVDKMHDAATKYVPGAGWGSAKEALHRRQREIARISTGASALDTLLDGGFETKAITEIHGEYRTGKTQLCHTLCVTCQLGKDEGGAAGMVAYIDTEGTFRPERIIQICARWGFDHNVILDNIVHARAYTHEHQVHLLTAIAAKMVEERFKLIIVDSIMACFRVDYSGRGELAERQQKLGAFLCKLKKLAEEFNVAIVITNHVISDPGGGAMFVSDPKKPIGGHVLAHACTTRLMVRKGKAEQRVCKVVHSCSLGEGEASFQISNEGVVDYKD